jgi:FAD/FMN-containing dehydrogenase
VTHFHSVLAAMAVLVLGAVPVSAETYRFVETDGTVHFTNTPTDPQYQRLGFTSGTERGWLQLPLPDLAPYAREIREAAARYGVEEGLIKAVIRVESGFNSRAVSPKGARGLMQLMPGTASMLGVRDSFDPRQNIDGGVRHLRGLIDRFGSDLKLALAAYNAGEQAVMNHRGIPPYRETRDYVTRILGLFAPAPAEAAPAAAPEPQYTYRVEAPDGTVTYTNIPPNGKL